MNYASQSHLVKSFVLDTSEKRCQILLFEDDYSLQQFKESAYKLFYDIITVPAPYLYQEPNPIVELFRLIESSLGSLKSSQKAILSQLEKWWVEWHFVASMNVSLERENKEQDYNVISTTQHPMRKHELSHYARLFTILPLPVCDVCMVTGDILKVNQRFIDVFGYTLQDVPNLNVWWKLAYPEKDYRTFAQTLWQESLEQANQK